MNEQLIPLKQVADNPYQHREVYADIEELGRTIAAVGLQQAPKARANGKGYQLKFGHRRKRAFDWLSANWKKEGLTDRYDGYTVMPLEIEDLTDREMFEAMVIENIHRDDLKPTEVASLLKAYQEQFPEATSKEIGLVFGMNEATVRGVVRFLDLPEEARLALDAGKITQGTARTLLSMQKIVSAEQVAGTVKQIEKQNGYSLPEEVIEETIDRLDNVVGMWNDVRDGKPRAGYHGWLLDMKNFPNQLLPALDRKTANLTPEQSAHLTNPPTCTACPFYTKVRGRHYCGLKICHERKTVAWGNHVLAQASKQTGIAVYQESDGMYRKLDWNDKALFEKKHKDLRLMAGSSYHQHFKGLDDDHVSVVATGEALNKLSSRTSTSGRGKKTEQEKAEMRALKIYRMRRKELVWEFAGVARKLLDGVPFDVLERLERNVGVDDRPLAEEPGESAKLDARADYLRQIMIYGMLIDRSSAYCRETMAEIVEGIQEEIKAGWGVKVPAALIKRTSEWDEEINEAASVAVETKKGK